MTHTGHRERVKQKFLTGADSSFHDHELLELLLFYSIPQRNTNDLAHMLLDRFGSLNGVLSASIESLISVPGIGRESAILIKTCASLTNRSQNFKKDLRIKLNTYEKTVDFLVSLFKGKSEEQLYAIFLNNSLKVLGTSEISDGRVNFSDSDARLLIENSLKYSASYVILSHNHPFGIAVPSTDDVESTYRAIDALKFIKVKLLEHFVVADGRVSAIIHKGDTHSNINFDSVLEEIILKK